MTPQRRRDADSNACLALGLARRQIHQVPLGQENAQPAHVAAAAAASQQTHAAACEAPPFRAADLSERAASLGLEQTGRGGEGIEQRAVQLPVALGVRGVERAHSLRAVI